MSLNQDYLTTDQMDTLQELMNIGIGRAASVLNDMLETPVHLKVPFANVVRIADLHEELKVVGREEIATVNVEFNGPMNGSTSLMFPKEIAAKLVALFSDGEEDETSLDAIHVGALTEIGNVVLNGLIGSIANLAKCPVEYAVPFYNEIQPVNLFASMDRNPNALVILTRATFAVQMDAAHNGAQVEGGIIVVLGGNGLETLVTAIDEMIPAEELTT